MKPSFRHFAILILMFEMATPAFADPQRVELRISSRVVASADYWPGEVDKPNLLIIHGFLQTREFPTVRRLAEALADSGYGVLTPTLSLGIDRRAKSLACEAIHTHDMAQDTYEIGRWSRWLYRQGRSKPILIGHSAGSVNLLAYLSSAHRPEVSRALLISLTYFGRGPAAHETPEMAARARLAVSRGEPGLERYALAYCKTYTTLAANYLSYYRWSRDHIHEIISRIRQPLDLIIGSKDGRIDKDWIDSLPVQSVMLHTVEGANHFFDQEHEFTLLDQVEELLEQAR